MRFLSRPLMVLGLVVGASALHAQDVKAFYGAGLTTNGSAVAATALVARQVSPDTVPGMYLFSMYDAVPTKAKPLTVVNSVGAGIAQKVATIAGVDIFAPTTAGVAFTGGGNVGFSWNFGLMAPIKLKNSNYYIAPSVRAQKASVGGDGYTPLFSVLVGWGK